MAPAHALRCGFLPRAGVVACLAVLLLATLVPPLAATGEVRNGQGLLWRIEAEGQPASFLLGTMHTTDPEVLSLPDPVTAAFGATSSLTVELLIDETVRAEMGQAMLLTDGRKLSQILGPERFARVAKVALQYGWPARFIEHMKPWAAMTVFSLPPAELDRQASGILPLDQMLQEEAEARGLPVYQLESAAEQLGIFDDMPEDDQIAFLEMVVTQHHELERWFEELRALYLSRNTGGMIDVMERQAAGGDPELLATFQEHLLDRRNRLMAERMVPRLQEGGAFVAVGALHLPGQTGLVALLREAGYRVTALY